MKQNLFINQLEKNNPELSQFLSPITDNDRELITSFFKKPLTDSINDLRINFENSFEYIRMYFNSGRYQGFKFYDGENLIVFALEKKKKPHFKLFKPLGNMAQDKLPEVVAILNSVSPNHIQMVCLDKDILTNIKKSKKLETKNIKQFNYWIYDLDTLNDLCGVKWKNVRQKISKFEKNYPKLKIERLNTNNCEDVIHFIGIWRRTLLSRRGLSYSNIEKNKFAAQYYAKKNDFDNIWSTVYRLSGRVVAFQLLYRLEPKVAAHAIGLTDTSIPGLSEATQVNIWGKLYGSGIRYINDGASWRPGLERYKQKFNPISAQRVFECKLKSK